jgi:hypothetical protein
MKIVSYAFAAGALIAMFLGEEKHRHPKHRFRRLCRAIAVEV